MNAKQEMSFCTLTGNSKLSFLLILAKLQNLLFEFCLPGSLGLAIMTSDYFGGDGGDGGHGGHVDMMVILVTLVMNHGHGGHDGHVGHIGHDCCANNAGHGVHDGIKPAPPP